MKHFVYGLRLNRPGARLHGRIVYVGYTSDPQGRRSTHKFNAFKRKTTALHHAIVKYGFECFAMEILSEHETRCAALLAEIETIARLGTQSRSGGYNRSSGGEGARDLDLMSREKIAATSRVTIRRLQADAEWKARSDEAARERLKRRWDDGLMYEAQRKGAAKRRIHTRESLAALVSTLEYWADFQKLHGAAYCGAKRLGLLKQLRAAMRSPCGRRPRPKPNDRRPPSERQLEMLRTRNQSDKQRQISSEARNAYWRDPAKREAQRLRAIQQHKDRRFGY